MDFFNILLRDIENIVFSRRDENNNYDELMGKVIKELAKRYNVTLSNKE